ncbi:cilia- and flagella-associated protein 299-like [Drosophila nasuta]|uniref:cilia- and flagella-associated protein 299-like n=1 Tax=Drosophila nasuta TaxID=42062 RepID=UPI00295F3101|nr:cilia- and flagella-associated protein 299-like [Drosophila nasuta]
MTALRPDFTLLNFETYEEYLQSFQTVKDHRYLGCLSAINELAKLGYRNTSRIYNEEEFKLCRMKTLELMNPKIKMSITSGHLVKSNDPGLQALAERETPNLLKKLSTIIFVVIRMPSGFDVSSYVDYEMSLRQFDLNVLGASNWKEIFQGNQKLHPKSSDLSYYNMQKKQVTHNNSDNYQTLAIGNSLLFLHKGDHKIIDPEYKCGNPTSKRRMIFSPSLGTIVLYDHIVRKPI